MNTSLDDRTVQAVLVVVAVGLLARFVFLGARISHYDEARVAWWGLEYLRTGETTYRYIIHGPFLQLLHRPLFAAFGPTDFVARAPVALITGLFPLVALWFRRYLSDLEVVGMALFLALNPIILYYSRFMRSSMLVAAFCFVAFAALVRLLDGDGISYLYTAAGALAFGFAAKENAIVYALCWLGAGALLLDTALFRPRQHDSGWDLLTTTLGDWRQRYGPDTPAGRQRLLGYGLHLVGAVTLFALLTFFFFAPRGTEAGLWTGNLSLTLDATLSDISEGLDYWFGQGEETTFTTYIERLGLFVKTTLTYAGPLFVLSLVGFVVERYARPNSRPLVLACAYWGFASVLGYPLGTDIWGAWIIVNALVPLSVPAAVGLGFLLDIGRDAVADEDRVSVAAVAMLLLLVVGQVAVVGGGAVYAQPTSPDNELVQFAQPQQEMRASVDATTAAAAANTDGPDALFYGGEDFVTMDETAVRSPACINWFRTLPWAWYLDANDVSVTCANSTGTMPEQLPPVVVAQADCTLERAVACRDNPEALSPPQEIAQRVPDRYERHAYLHRTTGGSYFHGVVVYVDPEA
ncbi:TIGR03663 family protein [Natronomonas halophila]|uniref:flippase activity-associated protein Agl23 n=1 Tax=Natronomonas halophila TaxID=2747817 RepID=UPI0015B50963|nr:flippase activity-associated protein Agl23 [Natronomonas halophila]QLD86191.1 TIGR03663 family protein [Natronomonas halophila]